MTCSTCEQDKPPTDFYSFRKQYDCKQCIRTKVRLYAQSPKGRLTRRKYARSAAGRAGDRKNHRLRRQTSEGREYDRRYRQTEKYKARRRRYESQYYLRAEPRARRVIIAERHRARKLSTDDGTVTNLAVRRLLQKQNHLCNLCRTDLNITKKNLDHKYPLSLGGPHTISNVQWLCAVCNIRKSNRV